MEQNKGDNNKYIKEIDRQTDGQTITCDKSIEGFFMLSFVYDY